MGNSIDYEYDDYRDYHPNWGLQSDWKASSDTFSIIFQGIIDIQANTSRS